MAARTLRNPLKSLSLSLSLSLSVSFSLYHSLSLSHFIHFIHLTHSYYDHLSVIVDIPGLFTTRSFHFALGVFQGGTLSSILFNIVIQLALDVFEKHQRFCYTFSCDQETSLLSSAYADDIQLVTRFPEQKQRLLDTFSEFLLWTRTMEARPNKCWSVALKICADGYHRFDPQLTISGKLLKAGPPLEAILVIFGRRALIFFLFESSWKK